MPFLVFFLKRWWEQPVLKQGVFMTLCEWPSTQQQIKLGWALFVTYTIIQCIMRSEMCSLHLTHPSAHTWSSGQPAVQRPGSSRGLPVGAGIRTHNLGLPRVSSPTLYPLGQRLPPLGHKSHSIEITSIWICMYTLALYLLLCYNTCWLSNQNINKKISYVSRTPDKSASLICHPGCKSLLQGWTKWHSLKFCI